jgi:hypothetical protein
MTPERSRPRQRRCFGVIALPRFYGGHIHSFDALENDLWMNVLEKFTSRMADAVAFIGITSIDSLSRIPEFFDWIPGAAVRQRLPAGIDTGIRTPDGRVASNTQEVLVLELTADVLERIGRRRLDGWGRMQLVFIRSRTPILHIIPPIMMRYMSLTPTLLRELCDADRRIASRRNSPELGPPHSVVFDVIPGGDS